MTNGYCDNLTIDRINNDGNYEPNNCRWVTQREQSNNTRKNRLLTYNGVTLSMADWAYIFDIRPISLAYRLNHGWSIDKALNTPVRSYRKCQ
jgi:hypothetical protein